MTELRSNYGSNPRAIRVIVIFCVCVMCVISNAQMARSTNYDLEYGVVGSGSGISESSDQSYSIVGLITTEGAIGDQASSDDYSIEPLIGGTVETQAIVINWVKY